MVHGTDSAELIVDLVRSTGLKLFQTLIYQHRGTPGLSYPHFRSDHEYMIVFVKGDRPSCVEYRPFGQTAPEPKHSTRSDRETDGSFRSIVVEHSEKTVCGTVWKVDTPAQPTWTGRLTLSCNAHIRRHFRFSLRSTMCCASRNLVIW